MSSEPQKWLRFSPECETMRLVQDQPWDIERGIGD